MSRLLVCLGLVALLFAALPLPAPASHAAEPSPTPGAGQAVSVAASPEPVQLEQELRIVVAQALATYPVPVQLIALEYDGRILTLNLSGEARTLVEKETFHDLLAHLNAAINDYLDQQEAAEQHSFDYRVLIDGTPLDQLVPQAALPPDPQVTAIEGHRVVLNPGHGWYNTGARWSLQRGYWWNIVEDFINVDLVREMADRLRQAGADVRPTRELNQSAGNHAAGFPFWQMAASEYVRSLGAPTSVWNTGTDGLASDIRARGLYANWVGANTMVSIHNNGGRGCGTETWYDTSNGHQEQSRRLAEIIQRTLIERLRARWNAGWCDRGVKGANGSYGENRIFNGPAALVEVAFMDTQSDNAALQNASFRTIVSEAVSDAVIEFAGGRAPTTCAPDQYRAEFFNNLDLSGTPIIRCESLPAFGSIDHSWAWASPAAGVNADLFSARWTGRQHFDGGHHTFFVRADDGVRLWIDGNLIIDAWHDQPATFYWATYEVSPGDHDIRLEYYERQDVALLQFHWAPACPTDQYQAIYYNRREPFGAPSFMRCEAQINQDWNDGGPGNGVEADNFAVRWIGRFVLPQASYTFSALADDGLRAWVDRSLLLNEWRDQVETRFRAARTLEAGEHEVMVEYYENGGGAVVQFDWQANTSLNLALNRPAFAWSIEDSSKPAANGNDGNQETRWSSQQNPWLGVQWWWTDLGAEQAFNEMSINWEAAVAQDHCIAWWNPGDRYVRGYTCRSGATAGQSVYRIGTQTARYIGVYMTGRAPGMTNYSFWEFELYHQAQMRTASDEVIEATAGRSPLAVPQQTRSGAFFPLLLR